MKVATNRSCHEEHVALRSGLVGSSSARRFVRVGLARDRGIALSSIAALLLALVPHATVAGEGGGSSKALGVDTVLSGVMPPPGLLLTTYLARYDAHHVLDSSGKDRPGISNFDLGLSAVTFRFQQVWSGARLWGADIETRLGFNIFIDVPLRFDVQTPKGSLHRQDSATGVGDALLGPALLGWHGQRLHQIAGLEIFLPTGHFDKTQLANQGRGYLAVAPAYFLTWTPTDATEVSANIFYLYNLENHDTNYRTGHEVSIDYGLGYELKPRWQIGASGYIYKQITDDRQDGHVVGDGNRGQAVAIGPFIRYHPGKGWGITLKWQRETRVENRSRGDRVFLQFAFKLR